MVGKISRPRKAIRCSSPDRQNPEVLLEWIDRKITYIRKELSRALSIRDKNEKIHALNEIQHSLQNMRIKDFVPDPIIYEKSEDVSKLFSTIEGHLVQLKEFCQSHHLKSQEDNEIRESLNDMKKTLKDIEERILTLNLVKTAPTHLVEESLTTKLQTQETEIKELNLRQKDILNRLQVYEEKISRLKPESPFDEGSLNLSEAMQKEASLLREKYERDKGYLIRNLRETDEKLRNARSEIEDLKKQIERLSIPRDNSKETELMEKLREAELREKNAIEVLNRQRQQIEILKRERNEIEAKFKSSENNVTRQLEELRETRKLASLKALELMDLNSRLQFTIDENRKLREQLTSERQAVQKTILTNADQGTLFSLQSANQRLQSQLEVLTSQMNQARNKIQSDAVVIETQKEKLRQMERNLSSSDMPYRKDDFKRSGSILSDDQLETLLNQIRELRNQVSEANRIIAELKDALDNREQALNQLRESQVSIVRELESLRSQYTKADNGLQIREMIENQGKMERELAKQYQQLQASITSKEEFENVTKELESVTKQLSIITKERDALRSELNDDNKRSFSNREELERQIRENEVRRVETSEKHEMIVKQMEDRIMTLEMENKHMTEEIDKQNEGIRLIRDSLTQAYSKISDADVSDISLVQLMNRILEHYNSMEIISGQTDEKIKERIQYLENELSLARASSTSLSRKVQELETYRIQETMRASKADEGMISDLEEEIADMKQANTSLYQRIEDLEKEHLQNISNKEERIRTLEKELEESNRSVNVSSDRYENKLKDMEDRLTSLRMEHENTISADKSLLESEIEKCARRIAEYDNRIENLNTEKMEMKEQFEKDIKIVEERHMEEIKVYAERIKNLENASSMVSEDKLTLANQRIKIAEEGEDLSRKELMKLRSEIKELQRSHEEEISRLTREREELQRAHEEEISRLNREREELQRAHEEEISRLNREREELNELLKKCKEDEIVYKAKAEEVEKGIENFEKIRLELNRIQNDYQTKDDEVKRLSLSLDIVRKEKDEMSLKILEMESEKGRMKMEIESMDKIIKDLNRKISEMEQSISKGEDSIKSELSDLKNQIEVYKKETEKIIKDVNGELSIQTEWLKPIHEEFIRLRNLVVKGDERNIRLNVDEILNTTPKDANLKIRDTFLETFRKWNIVMENRLNKVKHLLMKSPSLTKLRVHLMDIMEFFDGRRRISGIDHVPVQSDRQQVGRILPTNQLVISGAFNTPPSISVNTAYEEIPSMFVRSFFAVFHFGAIKTALEGKGIPNPSLANEIEREIRSSFGRGVGENSDYWLMDQEELQQFYRLLSSKAIQYASTISSSSTDVIMNYITNLMDVFAAILDSVLNFGMRSYQSLENLAGILISDVSFSSDELYGKGGPSKLECYVKIRVDNDKIDPRYTYTIKDDKTLEINYNPAGTNATDQFMYNTVYGPFTRVFGGKNQPKDIGKNMPEVVRRIKDGGDAMIVMLGPSGAGKTSIMLHHSRMDEEMTVLENTDGVLIEMMYSLPESLDDVRIQGYEVHHRYITETNRNEPYWEISDLFISDINSSKRTPVTLRYQRLGGKWIIVDPVGSTVYSRNYKPGSTVCQLSSGKDPVETAKYEAIMKDRMDDIGQLLAEVITRRLNCGTPNNPESSRSHMFLSLSFKNGAKLVIADMAGREQFFDCENEAILKLFMKNRWYPDFNSVSDYKKFDFVLNRDALEEETNLYNFLVSYVYTNESAKDLAIKIEKDSKDVKRTWDKIGNECRVILDKLEKEPRIHDLVEKIETGAYKPYIDLLNFFANRNTWSYSYSLKEKLARFLDVEKSNDGFKMVMEALRKRIRLFSYVRKYITEEENVKRVCKMRLREGREFINPTLDSFEKIIEFYIRNDEETRRMAPLINEVCVPRQCEFADTNCFIREKNENTDLEKPDETAFGILMKRMGLNPDNILICQFVVINLTSGDDFSKLYSPIEDLLDRLVTIIQAIQREHLHLGVDSSLLEGTRKELQAKDGKDSKFFVDEVSKYSDKFTSWNPMEQSKVIFKERYDIIQEFEKIISERHTIGTDMDDHKRDIYRLSTLSDMALTIISSMINDSRDMYNRFNGNTSLGVLNRLDAISKRIPNMIRKCSSINL